MTPEHTCRSPRLHGWTLLGAPLGAHFTLRPAAHAVRRRVSTLPARDIFRTLIVYVYALLLLRWLGSRTIGQLSTIEFLLVIALGSAVGDAMFYPDVPLLHALLVVTIVVLANKGLDMLIARFKTAERVIDGMPEEAIRDGVFRNDFL